MLRLKAIHIALLLFIIIGPHPVESQKVSPFTGGAILEVNVDRTYSPAEIDQEAKHLFESADKRASRFFVDVYYIRFSSKYLDGSEAQITAQLFVPRYKEQVQRPAYVFATGSTGIIDVCRPSREHIAGVNWGLYRIHMLSHAGQGNIAMLPDYTGFGDPDRLQPYYVARAEAMMLLDAIRALHTFFQERDFPVRPHPEVFLAGYSQGGNAIFAAADYRDGYAPDVEIAGIIGYGPARGVEDLFREFTVSAPLVIYTYSRIYGEDRFNPSLILQDRWLNRLAYDVTRLCIVGIQDYYPWTPEKLYRPEFNIALHNGTLSETYPSIANLLQENSTGLSGHGIPTIILQGTEDVVVWEDTQTEFVINLREKGSEVLYLIYDGARHDTRQISFDRVVRWMEEQISNQ